MGSSQILSLPGMTDVTGSAHQKSAQVAETFASYFATRGYEPIDTPIVEDAELFVRKSGGELSGMLYTFDDPGGNRVSLRPEFTPSVIRYYVEHSAALNTPVRWQYGGPVFRFHRSDEGNMRQYTQVGAELIGSKGVESDAEIIGVAWRGLCESGLDDCTIRIGDTGLLNSVLGAQGLSDAAQNFVFNHVAELKGSKEPVDRLVSLASDMGLLQTEIVVGRRTLGVGSGATRELIQEMLSDSMSSPIGRRTTEHIVERLHRKLQRADHPDKLKAALTLVAEISKVEGPPDEALRLTREIFGARGVDTSALVGLGGLVGELASQGIPASSVTFDLGLVRGIAYYTGVVFEITHENEEGETIVGGGGRYDGLVEALGGEDVPALGFALSLDKIVSRLAKKRS